MSAVAWVALLFQCSAMIAVEQHIAAHPYLPAIAQEEVIAKENSVSVEDPPKEASPRQARNNQISVAH